MPDVGSLEPVSQLTAEPPPPLRPPLADPVPAPDTGAGAGRTEPARSPETAAPTAALRPRRLTAGAALLAVSVLSGLAGSAITRELDDRSTISSSTRSATVDRSLQLDGDALDVAAVVAKAGPAVVAIQTSYGLRTGRGAGTGVVLSSDGEILTNAHVVDGASTVQVVLAGEAQSREAQVVGADSGADLALLRIPGASGLPTAELGSSAAVAVGDDVVAIGNALALQGGPTVTRGIVSALDRTLETGGAGAMTGLIQTDASISSGNSGGPLVNAAGLVIGINTAVAASRGGTAAENIGFAIAIDEAMPVVEKLRGNTAAARPGLLGVSTTDPDDGSRGAVVTNVVPDSPAARAGIREGDLITAVGRRTVAGAATLGAAIRSEQPGSTVSITVVRSGRTRTVEATLTASPGS